jgi:hypothetical protein
MNKGGRMKAYKLEFVLFNISHENAVFLWSAISRVIQFLGFDVTGDVTDETKLETCETSEVWVDKL